MDLRSLPAVDALAARLDAPHPVAVAAAREVIAQQRAELLAGSSGTRDLLAAAQERAQRMHRPSLRRVLNATGVIVHTNLGRAPLAREARDAVAAAAEGYSNLELDLESGRRGSRQAHVEHHLVALTGAEAALVVNNCAGAALLAVAALAGRERDVVVSRGQLIEIGGAFRVPEVIEQAGARLVEVGTTNRTRLADYERAIGPQTGALLRAHPSNFRQLGFVEDVSIEALCSLGVPVIDDVGSGVLADELAAVRDEPPVRRSVRAGAALTCFSGDKLLGGPQAGLLVGTADAVGAARRHPLARALRIDALSLAALDATLRLYREPERARREIPVLAMLAAEPATLEGRAAALADRIGPPAVVVGAVAKVGGGALPLLDLPGPAVALAAPGRSADELAARLRAGDPPVVGRIEDGQVLLDVRTLADEELEAAAGAVRAALESP